MSITCKGIKTKKVGERVNINMNNTTMPEFLQNRPSYKQRITAIKAEAKQMKRKKTAKEFYKFSCILSAMFVLLIICGLFN